MPTFPSWSFFRLSFLFLVYIVRFFFFFYLFPHLCYFGCPFVLMINLSIYMKLLSYFCFCEGQFFFFFFACGSFMLFFCSSCGREDKMPLVLLRTCLLLCFGIEKNWFWTIQGHVSKLNSVKRFTLERVFFFIGKCANWHFTYHQTNCHSPWFEE